ncbi:hypothetical protein Q0A17_05580 [Citrobacter sp. S2-9]|uniref:DUF4760 domain-containing protein n=1 Tax=Citrobacter enshiensis TaxID=2971264 RepID=A0ABT8PSB3_9ENTR|nr:hypothetical protein [Citrobacter enshiensis]MDN8598882.1 hypothetical protein [Citrobacter enshiensis]
MDCISKKTFTIILLLLVAILIAIAYWGDDQHYFVGSFVPEFIGVCLELLIILKVFEVWQQRDEKRKLIKVERRLREFLIFFVNHTCKSFPRSCRPGRFYGVDYEQNQSALDKLINYIEENGLAEDVVVSVQKYCKSEYQIINNLIPVSAELENDHFKSWVRIAYYMNAVANGQEKASVAMVSILENIKRFDKESHDKNLYVGAS